MLNIDDYKADDYLVEFTERRATGTASPLDIANMAFLNASQIACILGECEDETVLADAEDTLTRVRLANEAVGIAERRGDKALAMAFALAAEEEALVLDTFDSVKIEGLPRVALHA